MRGAHDFVEDLAKDCKSYQELKEPLTQRSELTEKHDLRGKKVKNVESTADMPHHNMKTLQDSGLHHLCRCRYRKRLPKVHGDDCPAMVSQKKKTFLTSFTRTWAL
jgi:hypothetical protein